MPCGTVRPSGLFANPREAYLFLADVSMGRAKGCDEKRIWAALDDVQLAVLDNINLHEQVEEMARIIADLNRQLEARKQVVFA